MAIPDSIRVLCCSRIHLMHRVIDTTYARQQAQNWHSSARQRQPFSGQLD